jgi:MOSC domain-containing protein YiiM
MLVGHPLNLRKGMTTRDGRLARAVIIDRAGRLVSVNVGRPRPIDRSGQPTTTAIWKSPVVGRVEARGINLVGDEQADRAVHGGRDKAVYAYALEDTTWWEDELGHPLGPGAFGENLTVAGLALSDAVVGQRWTIGSAVLEVSEPRLPCWKLGARMGDAGFVRRFTAAGRSGTYLRIAEEGDIGAGDAVDVDSPPAHGVTVSDIWRIYHRDRRAAHTLLTVPELGESWRAWAREHARVGDRGSEEGRYNREFRE